MRSLVLKPLERAEADGDAIYGVIRGTAVNHGGRAKSLTAPNPQAQAELLMAAYSRAGVGPETVGYIEAHGTGTELGDPIEVHGLKRAFAAMAERGGVELARGYCGLGTVKSNIGHLEAAAGVAGLVKVLLSLRHGILPASLHCRELNPYLQLEESPFYVVDSTRAWEPMVGPSGERLPRRAGISSFGFGGANAHAVLEEYTDRRGVGGEEQGVQLLVISARDEERLKSQAENLRRYLNEGGEQGARLSDVAYTLQVGREEMETRLAFVARNRREAVDTLEGFLGGKADGVYLGQVRGQGQRGDLLGEGPQVKQFLSSLVAAGDWPRIARLWVEGRGSPGPSSPRRRLAAGSRCQATLCATALLAARRGGVRHADDVGLWCRRRPSDPSAAGSQRINPGGPAIRKDADRPRVLRARPRHRRPALAAGRGAVGDGAGGRHGGWSGPRDEPAPGGLVTAGPLPAGPRRATCLPDPPGRRCGRFRDPDS